jgi:hypothetical protein
MKEVLVGLGLILLILMFPLCIYMDSHCKHRPTSPMILKDDRSCHRHPVKEPLWEEQAAFAQDVSLLLAFVFNSGYLCTLGEAWRSCEQAEIYAKEGKGIVHSQHCRRLAIDLNLYSKDGTYLKDDVHYRKIGIYWESIGKKNRWGGHFKGLIDLDHFERNV